MKTTMNSKRALQIFFISMIVSLQISTIIGQRCLQAANGRTFPRLENNGIQVEKLVHQYQAIIPSYQFTCCGQVMSWGFDMQPGGGMDKKAYTLAFQVWRPANDVETSGCYSLVQQNRYSSLTPIDSVIIINSSRIAATERISVQPGDVVGVYVASSHKNPENRGIALDDNQRNELMWYARVGMSGMIDPSDTCMYPVGTTGVLDTSTTIAPYITVSVATSDCPEPPLRTSRIAEHTVTSTTEQLPTHPIMTSTTEQLPTHPIMSSTIEQLPKYPIMTSTIERLPTHPIMTSTIEQLPTHPIMTSTIEQLPSKESARVSSTSKLDQLRPTTTAVSSSSNENIPLNSTTITPNNSSEFSANGIPSLWSLLGIVVLAIVLIFLAIFIAVIVRRKKKYRIRTSPSKDLLTLSTHLSSCATLERRPTLESRATVLEDDLSEGNQIEHVTNTGISSSEVTAQNIEYIDVEVVTGPGIAEAFGSVVFGSDKNGYSDINHNNKYELVSNEPNVENDGTTYNQESPSSIRNATEPDVIDSEGYDYARFDDNSPVNSECGGNEASNQKSSGSVENVTEQDVTGTTEYDYARFDDNSSHDGVINEATNKESPNSPDSAVNATDPEVDDTQDNAYETIDSNIEYDYVDNQREMNGAISSNKEEEEELLRSLDNNAAYIPTNGTATNKFNMKNNLAYNAKQFGGDQQVENHNPSNDQTESDLLSSLELNAAYAPTNTVSNKECDDNFDMKSNKAYNAKQFGSESYGGSNAHTCTASNSGDTDHEYINGSVKVANSGDTDHEYINGSDQVPSTSLVNSHSDTAGQTAAGQCDQSFSMKRNEAYNAKQFHKNEESGVNSITEENIELEIQDITDSYENLTVV